MKTYIKEIFSLIFIIIFWFIFISNTENILNFINSPKFILFISIIFILSFLYLIYLLIKEGFNKKTFLKFWNWTNKVIIIRLFIYILIFSLTFAYIIIPIQKYFYLNSL